jgi:hypothetical protein
VRSALGRKSRSCTERERDVYKVGDAPLEVGGPVRVDATGRRSELKPRRVVEAVVAMLEARCTTGCRLAAVHHVAPSNTNYGAMHASRLDEKKKYIRIDACRSKQYSRSRI